MLDPNTRHINVNGIKNVIEACKQNGVYRLIYTSSYNVIFGGDPIEGGDETMDYYPLNRHSDYYSSSKAEAEIAVLNENGKIVVNSNGAKGFSSSNIFFTSVIRPAAIYGEGELRHFPRIVKMIDSGLFTFTIGDALVDWVHIENLTQAFQKLSNKMLQLDTLLRSDQVATPPPPTSLGAYFISDGTPVKNFEFFRPIFLARDVDYPSVVLSKKFMLKVGYFCERFHLALKAVGINIEPFCTRAEVLKVGETHYFSIEKARKDLAYEPTLNSDMGGRRMGQFYGNNFDNSNYFRIADLYLWVLIFLGMGLLFHFAHSNNDYASIADSNKLLIPMDILQRFALLLFRSQENLKVIFDLAVATHVLEAIYATYICIIDLKCRNTWYMWSFQTFCLGYGSLQYLIRRKAFTMSKKKK